MCCLLIEMLLPRLQSASAYLFSLILLLFLISLKHPLDANKTHSVGIVISKQGRVIANMEVSSFLRKKIAGCVSHLLIFLVPF